mgnify:CR=1 FL=1
MALTIQAWAENRGYQVAWGSQACITEAKEDLWGRIQRGEFDPDFCASELDGLAKLESLPTGMTVVMVALPRPAHRLGFDLAEVGGGRLDAILPPTYLRYQATIEEVRQDLERNGLPGARVEHLHGPCKALATRIGLARYGRNNLAYVEGMGSYLQLCAFLTDAPLPEGSRSEDPALLPQCQDCERCSKACPTGAITRERVLLRGERCLTHINEGSRDWPAWASNQRHHSLIGCLLCQKACPANASLPTEDTGLCFSARETAALAAWPEPLPPSLEDGVRRKLAWLGQPSLYPVLGRNLAALLSARSRASSVPAPSGSFPA